MSRVNVGDVNVSERLGKLYFVKRRKVRFGRDGKGCGRVVEGRGINEGEAVGMHHTLVHIDLEEILHVLMLAKILDNGWRDVLARRVREEGRRRLIDVTQLFD